MPHVVPSLSSSIRIQWWAVCLINLSKFPAKLKRTRGSLEEFSGSKDMKCREWARAAPPPCWSSMHLSKPKLSCHPCCRHGCPLRCLTPRLLTERQPKTTIHVQGQGGGYHREFLSLNITLYYSIIPTNPSGNF